MRILLCCPAVLAAVTKSGSEKNMALKVVEMLQGMVKKTEDEQKNDTASHNASIKEKKEATFKFGLTLKREKEKKDEFTAAKEKANAAEKELQQQIAELDAAIEQYEAEKKKVQAQQAQDAKDCADGIFKLRETVEALERAESSFVGGSTESEKPEALLQTLQSSSTAVKTYLTLPQATQTVSQDQTKAIVDIIKKVKREQTKELRDFQNGCNEKGHNHTLLLSDLDNNIDKSNTSREDKIKKRAEQVKKLGEAKTNLQAATDAIKNLTGMINTVKRTIATEEAAYKKQNESFTSELEALGSALEVLTNNATFQAPSETSFVQVKASVSADDNRRIRQRQVLSQVSARLIEASARLQNSHKTSALTLISTQIMTESTAKAEDPFVKIKGMIQDMIDDLKEKRSGQAARHAWCTEENEKAQNKKKQIENKSEDLRGQQEGLQVDIETLKQEKAELIANERDLSEELAKTAKQRQEDKTKNEQTIKDAQEAQAAVSQALSVLNDFYSATEGGKTQEGTSRGVIGMLETILADVEHQEASAKAAEDMAVEEFATFQKESKRTIKDMKDSLTDVNKQIISGNAKLRRTEDEIRLVDEDSAAVLQILSQLNKQCNAKPESHEERMKRMNGEVDALKEALQTLEESGSGGEA